MVQNVSTKPRIAYQSVEAVANKKVGPGFRQACNRVMRNNQADMESYGHTHGSNNISAYTPYIMYIPR